MPFSSFQDPEDVRRAHKALNELWRLIRPLVGPADQQSEHDRLAHVVASLTMASHDEEDLIEKAWERFWQR